MAESNGNGWQKVVLNAVIGLLVSMFAFVSYEMARAAMNKSQENSCSIATLSKFMDTQEKANERIEGKLDTLLRVSLNK